MSDQEAASTSAKKPGKSAAVWVVRVIIFGVLAALLVIAILDFRAKRQREASLNAIGDKLKPGAKLTLKEAEELLDGSPDIADARSGGGKKKKIYTWSSPFRSYKMAIVYETIGASTEVDRVSSESKDTD